MQILSKQITIEDLKSIAVQGFGDMLKAVDDVSIQKNIVNISNKWIKRNN
ncbi:MAG: hypothetical protein H8E85_01940 [Candidatus Marinimicrobia bacterium]|nr:hypothetical protein [Candidatus Neomarinimicrobiota bacterium]